MSSFYVGYGHKSIGDCGTITIFIEGVSMLVAKAIQDSQLYEGQEASTRYIDFASQKFINPIGSREGENVLERWRKFYLQGMPRVIEDLVRRFPRQEGEDEKTYEKAIKARAFDIMRGFLPAGASTNLAWHTNLRQAADRLMLLRHHPLDEVREIAEAIEDALKEAYPNSFNHRRHEETEAFNRDWMRNSYYYASMGCPDFAMDSSHFSLNNLDPYESLLRKRPAKTELPKVLAECGVIKFRFTLDFGSYRDIQRHRAVHQRMPLLTPWYGFEEWYMNELPEDLRAEATALIGEQNERIQLLSIHPVRRQHYQAMGNKVPNQVIGDLPALVYLIELRATRFVHPTLRRRASQMAIELNNLLESKGLVLHLDADPDRFDIRRGEHDIVLKA